MAGPAPSLPRLLPPLGVLLLMLLFMFLRSSFSRQSCAFPSTVSNCLLVWICRESFDPEHLSHLLHWTRERSLCSFLTFSFSTVQFNYARCLLLAPVSRTWRARLSQRLPQIKDRPI